MTNIKSHKLDNINKEQDTDINNVSILLSKIETNAREIDSAPAEIRQDENFVIQALQKNSLVTRFLTPEELKNDKIAFTLSLVITNHSELIKEKLQEENFYFQYISQKIKNKDIDDKETYINKDYFSKEENVLRTIKEAGYFKLKYLNDNLKDQEHMVDLFCNHAIKNQIWASKRIQEAAKEGGAEVHKYVKSKLFYEKLGNKFDKKPETKPHKI